MARNCTKGTKYSIQWETHPRNLIKSFCSLMEHQSLVDVAICCGNNTIQAHKFVLAANSPYFREEFEKNPQVEQVIISGCEFVVLKSIIEIMYYGQTIVSEDNVKFLVAVIKQFQLKTLEHLFAEHGSISDDIYLPKPQFLTKKPKYPAFTYQLAHTQNACLITVPPTTTAQQQQQPTNNPVQFNVSMPVPPKIANNVLKPLDFNIPVKVEPAPKNFIKPFVRGKRSLKLQAEQACVKEAHASRMALASLQKEIAVAPQVSSFVIEDAPTETTVENFIPHGNTFGQILNYGGVLNLHDNMENAMFLPMPPCQTPNNPGSYPLPALLQNGQDKRALSSEKLKHILDVNMPSNVEIMYKDAQGNYMPVNEEVLKSFSTKDGLQYQVLHEDGRLTDMQELQVIDKIEKIIDNADGTCSIITKSGKETNFIPMDLGPTMDLSSLVCDKTNSEILKFSPDMFFSDIVPVPKDVDDDRELFSESPQDNF
ncbi:uncharacterized protein LOC126733743 isoform X2 [Anthonomus grandis grandis]|uniref:uncharacterized protein LOC126733743 isoform X2 n=1 Tax=Anthonomus grandis grandis TaxID=2921223 RepID=UPI002165A3CC|nr:uncharacterized protein LOC126733743 isoform X2 [Anthonomus grandis grandis]